MGKYYNNRPTSKLEQIRDSAVRIHDRIDPGHDIISHDEDEPGYYNDRPKTKLETIRDAAECIAQITENPTGEYQYEVLRNVDVASFVSEVTAPIKKLTVGIKPVQDLHGYDSPWPAGGGKNIADLKETTVPVSSQFITISGSEGNLTFTSTANYGRAGYLFPTETGKTYTISFTYNKTQTQVNSTVFFNDSFDGVWKESYGRFNLGNNVVSDTYLSKTIVATSDTLFVGFYVSAGKGYPDIITVKDFQIELGSDATAYAPYANICPITGWTGANIYVSPTDDPADGRTYSVTFPSEAGTVYGGTLDVTSGMLTVNRAMVDLGTRLWRYSTGSTYDGFTATITDSSSAYIAKNRWKGICSVYPYVGSYTAVANKQCGYIFENYVYIKDDTYGTDTTAFKAAMSGVQLVYELATPVTYQLTPQQITTLLGENNVWADTGKIVHIKYPYAEI